MNSRDNLIRFMTEEKILSFGQFMTNSGRATPYFCNFGDIKDPLKLEYLTSLYADKIIETFGTDIDNVFGPAYKGITLSVMTAYSLSRKLSKPVSFTFNRKETKDHGEKGIFIGHHYKGDEKVVIVEDVLTSGKSLRAAYKLLEKTSCSVLGSIVCVDRQERDEKTNESAKQSLESETQKPIHCLLQINDVLDSLTKAPLKEKHLELDAKTLLSIKKYQASYLSRD